MGHGLALATFVELPNGVDAHAEQEQVFHQLHLFFTYVWFSLIWSHVTILA